jgi:hypothetical protein
MTDQDPLFVHGGVFDSTRFLLVDLLGVEHRLPDFIVESPDFHLQSGSPAIDAGTTDGAPSTDIEGHGRPCGAGVDAGAYETGDCPAPNKRFRRGDADSSGVLNITDPIVLLLDLFLGGEAPGCLDAADVDDSGSLNVTDAVHSLNHLFLGGPEPPAPYPECGVDWTADALGCERFEGCSQ